MEEISPDMVVEAYNLLRQSIISVEHDDVEMYDEEPQEDSETLLRAVDAASGRDQEGDAPMVEEEHEPERSSVVPEKRKLTITYDNYIKMVNMFVQRVNDDESGTGEGVNGEELVNWYLEQKESELEGEEDYHREKALANMVLKKMVKVSTTIYPALPCKKLTGHRKTFSWLFVARVSQTARQALRQPPRSSMFSTPTVLLRSSRLVDRWRRKKRMCIYACHDLTPWEKGVLELVDITYPVYGWLDL